MNSNLTFFKACFKNEMQSTINLLAAMPNDNLSYKPHPVNRSAKEIAEHILAHVLDLKIIIENNSFFKIIDPAGFIDIIALEKNARMLVTDSGGLQKEAFFFQKPCVILRPQTEWIEIIENGNALLAEADYDKIVHAFTTLNSKTDYSYPSFYGDGKAAEFICEKIIEHF